MRQTRRVGDILQLKRRKVDVELIKEYREIGIRSFGKGVFHKEPLTGAELGNKRVFHIEPGDLLLGNVFAWEGAVAVASEEERGFIGSHRFLTYEPTTGDVDINYLRYLFLSERGLDLLGRASPGSAGRNRTLAIDRFEALEVLLPPLDEQRRIVEQISQLFRRIDALNAAQADSTQIVGSLMAAIRHEVLGRLGVAAPETDVGSVAEILMGTSPPGHTYNDVGLGMPLLNGPTEFGVTHPTARQWTSSPTVVARERDLLMSVRASIGRMNWADREYCVGRGLAAIRPRTGVDGRYLRHVLILRASEMMAMTAGTTFPNLPGAKLKKLAVPLPPVTDQQRLANLLDTAETKVRAAKDLRASALGTLNVLPSSILNAAFVGRS